MNACGSNIPNKTSNPKEIRVRFKIELKTLFVSSLSSCRIPAFNFENSGRIGNNCITYISQNISYNGCVKNYRNDKNFMKNTWHIFLNRSQKLFDPKHDRVILRDSQDLIVDQFEY